MHCRSISTYVLRSKSSPIPKREKADLRTRSRPPVGWGIRPTIPSRGRSQTMALGLLPFCHFCRYSSEPTHRPIGRSCTLLKRPRHCPHARQLPDLLGGVPAPPFVSLRVTFQGEVFRDPLGYDAHCRGSYTRPGRGTRWRYGMRQNWHLGYFFSRDSSNMFWITLTGMGEEEEWGRFLRPYC